MIKRFKRWMSGLLIGAIALIVVCCASLVRSQTTELDLAACTYNGKNLFGLVKIVESSGELKVKPVESFPDLKVKIVDSFPDSCGKWKFVESSPDFTIQFVDSFPDLDIKFVESFPGIP
jgi:hypothetical protein